jgi:hypothetical protein
MAPAARSAIGFLTVVADRERGLFGGFLLLNAAGRPLEFHCTTPVRANRAQEILYGPTLEPYLYGEQIGHALVSQAAHGPAVVCTDCPAVLALRPLVDFPLAIVLPGEERVAAQAPAQPDRMLRVDPPQSFRPALAEFRHRTARLAVEAARADDQAAVCQGLVALIDTFDLEEPFDRIREAIAEAQRGG